MTRPNGMENNERQTLYRLQLLHVVSDTRARATSHRSLFFLSSDLQRERAGFLLFFNINFRTQRLHYYYFFFRINVILSQRERAFYASLETISARSKPHVVSLRSVCVCSVYLWNDSYLKKKFSSAAATTAVTR